MILGGFASLVAIAGVFFSGSPSPPGTPVSSVTPAATLTSPAVPSKTQKPSDGPVWPTSTQNPRQLRIEASLDGTTIDVVKDLHGTLAPLCCMETIWILVQPIGKDRLYPRGYCYDVGDAMWKACDGSGSFGPLGAPGDMVKVTAIVIHDGSEEDAYLYAAGHDGFAIGDLPSPPVSISNTVTVRLS